MTSKIYSVCVIGGGSAGTMAALRTVLNNDECLFFPGSPKNKKRSRAMWVKKVENMPSHLQFKRGIEDPNAETLKWISESPFKEKFIHHKNTGVISLKKENDVFTILDSKNNLHHAKFVILCTGVMDVQPEIKGTIDKVFEYANAQTIDYCLLCDGHHSLNKNVSVIGHSNTAAWISIMLYERYQPKSMTILTNGKSSEFEADTKKLIETYGIRVMESPIESIEGENRGEVLKSFTLQDKTQIQSDLCFISLGMIIYNELAKELGAELDERGFVKTVESGESSVAGLFVAGDLRANAKKQIYTAWDHAVNAANAINMKLRASKRPI
jgi:thioredoxin reductase (NADPH)